MNISSIADYLVNKVVTTASSLQQQNRESANQGVVRPLRDKSAQRVAEGVRVASPSSAYRVTISSAAMQKVAMSG
ncbi:MAG: hypothetical protein HQL88_07715 [Magnetococcales bacterium]|nr:hypothetical protein [Magnetococcales bacterium]